MINDLIICFIRLYPLHSGYGYLTRGLKRFIPKKEEPLVIARLRSGQRIYVNPRDDIGATVYVFGDHDPKITWIMRRVVRPNDVVIDVGSNIGVVSLIAAEIVGNLGQVHVFEPQPNLMAILRRSAALNGLENISFHDIALGTEDGYLNLFVPAGNAGAASLVRRLSAQGSSMRVPVRNAGSYLARLALPAIRFLKLDVEGYEGQLLEAARPFLTRVPPDFVLFELNDYSCTFSEQKSVSIIAKLGYKLFEIPRNLFRMRLYPIDLANPRVRYRGHDILAIHRDLCTSAVYADLNIKA